MIKFFIIGLWLLDVLFTYFNITNAKELFPDKSYSDMEMNRMNVFFWNKFGLKRGTIFSALCQIPLLIVLFLLINNDERILYMFFGMYVIIFYIHFENYFMVKRKLKTKGEEDGTL